MLNRCYENVAISNFFFSYLRKCSLKTIFILSRPKKKILTAHVLDSLPLVFEMNKGEYWPNDSTVACKTVTLGVMVNIVLPCHQVFWVHHMVGLLPSERATDRRTPTNTKTREMQKIESCTTPLIELLLFHYLDALTVCFILHSTASSYLKKKKILIAADS